jgi:hypothetical protein
MGECRMIPDMSKRIQVTLPERVAEELQRWADFDGRPLSNLAAYLLERAINESQREGAEWTRQKPSS